MLNKGQKFNLSKNSDVAVRGATDKSKDIILWGTWFDFPKHKSYS